MGKNFFSPFRTEGLCTSCESYGSVYAGRHGFLCPKCLLLSVGQLKLYNNQEKDQYALKDELTGRCDFCGEVNRDIRVTLKNKAKVFKICKSCICCLYEKESGGNDFILSDLIKRSIFEILSVYSPSFPFFVRRVNDKTLFRVDVLVETNGETSFSISEDKTGRPMPSLKMAKDFVLFSQNDKKKKESPFSLLIEQKLKSEIFGQDHVFNDIVNCLRIYGLKLSSETKPIGAFLLIGPTGVGKTEITKVLAKALGFNYVKIDCSEFYSDHKFSRFHGAPQGYIGHDKPTILEKLFPNKNDKTVIVFDEIEKAVAGMQDILLQVLSDAIMTLDNGKKIDFSNSIIFLTSNLGTDKNRTSSIGISQNQNCQKLDMKEVLNHFRPEFMGRLTSVLKFNSLDFDSMLKILDKYLKNFTLKIKDHYNCELKISLNAKKHLVKEGFGPKYGARSLEHYFQKTLVNEVAKIIETNERDSLLKICIFLKDGILCFQVFDNPNEG